MTIPEHQICVQDASERKYPFRNKEQKYQKPFIFKGYKTEEDRIKETLNQNGFLYNIIQDSKKKKEKEKEKKSLSDNEDKFNFDIPNHISPRKRKSIIEEEKLKDLVKHNILIQPQMRFKARTDLERVYDALRGKVFRDNEKNIIDRQLKIINLNIYQKPQDILKKMSFNLSEDEIKEDNKEEKRTYKIKPNPIMEEFKKKEKEKDVNHLIYGNGNLFYDPRKDYYSKPWKRNMDLNSEAEGILSEYHIKTHFKACAEVAEKKINYKNLKLSRNNLHKRTYTLDNNDLNKKRILNFEEPENLIDYDDYNKNENPYFLRKNDTVDPQTLKALSNIAFGKDSIIRGDTAVVEQYIPTGKKNKYYHKRKLVDENSVLIDGKILYKDSQFDIIANKVLNICNIYKKKNLNNNSNLKKGSGKLMFTKGLSVEQFRRKYNLND